MQRSHHRLIFLHGFLGSPSDWDEVIQFLPDFACLALPYPFEIPSDGVLVGYSMGGRIALRYPHRMVVISTHPGLQNLEEKAMRWSQDQEWIHRLQTLPFTDFLEQWYAQPIFTWLRQHPTFPQVMQRRLQQDPQRLAQMLAQQSLSHDSLTIPTNALFIHGQLDGKFKQLYKTLHIPSLEVPRVGHAPHLEDPEACAKMVRKALLEIS